VSAKHWFLPGDTDLLGMLHEQSASTVDGMHAFVAWAGGDPGAADEVRACEHRADESKRALWRALRDAFSPPMDAEDLFSLSADLDEVLNGAKDLVREMEVMAMEPDEPIREMAVLLSEAVEQLATALGRIGGHDDATEPADAAIKCQRKLEHRYRSAMSALLEVSEVREVIGRREAYRRLSRIGDQVHRVAERVWYAVVKEG